MKPVKVAKSPRLAIAVNSVRAQRHGQIAPLLVILVAVLFGAAGLVLDGGRIQFAKRHMQLAADAAAMGGAHELMLGQTGRAVIDAARDDAELNSFKHQNSDDNNTGGGNTKTTVAVNNPPLSGPRAGDSGFVEVIITKDYPTTFMRIMGVERAPVLARAVAGLVNYGEGCVLALNPTQADALQVNGGALLDAGCGVHVNSNEPISALLSNGGGSIDARPAGIGRLSRI